MPPPPAWLHWQCHRWPVDILQGQGDGREPEGAQSRRNLSVAPQQVHVVPLHAACWKYVLINTGASQQPKSSGVHLPIVSLRCHRSPFEQVQSSDRGNKWGEKAGDSEVVVLLSVLHRRWLHMLGVPSLQTLAYPKVQDKGSLWSRISDSVNSDSLKN